jgi:secondary thiamine-phosphate synthase enzyme
MQRTKWPAALLQVAAAKFTEDQGRRMMRENICVKTTRREELVDITAEVQEAVAHSGVQNGLAVLYVQGATAALMVQENWDDSIQTDVVNLLRTLIPRGAWLHDRQDGNGDSHLKAGLVGPSESIPVIEARLGLSRWQNIFLCEFDGPRKERVVVCTFLADE